MCKSSSTKFEFVFTSSASNSVRIRNWKSKGGEKFSFRTNFFRRSSAWIEPTKRRKCIGRWKCEAHSSTKTGSWSCCRTRRNATNSTGFGIWATIRYSKSEEVVLIDFDFRVRSEFLLSQTFAWFGTQSWTSTTTWVFRSFNFGAVESGIRVLVTRWCWKRRCKVANTCLDFVSIPRNGSKEFVDACKRFVARFRLNRFSEYSTPEKMP